MLLCGQGERDGCCLLTESGVAPAGDGLLRAQPVMFRQETRSMEQSKFKVLSEEEQAPPPEEPPSDEDAPAPQRAVRAVAWRRCGMLSACRWAGRGAASAHRTRFDCCAWCVC